MLAEWLYRTTLELSPLIGLVLLLRPVVRRTLGARAAYRLWFIPLLRAVSIDRPEWPRTVVENVGVPGGELSVAIYPSPDVWVLPAGVPWGALWLSGALLWIALRVTGAVRFRRALARESSAIDLPPRLVALIPERLRRRKASYFATDRPGAPFVTGLARPLVYLPTDFFQRYSVEEQKWVVRHELTHAARADLWVQSVWELLRGVFWFNPAVHLAAGAVRADQELACDQAVVGRGSNEDRYTYGRALMGGGARAVPSLLGFFGNQRQRIAMIGNHKVSLRRDIVGIGLCALVGACTLTKVPVTELVFDDPINLHIREMPVTLLVESFAKQSGIGEVTGLEQLANRTATAQVNGVPARDVLQGILNCAGFAYEERGSALAIVPLTGRAASAPCISVGWNFN